MRFVWENRWSAAWGPDNDIVAYSAMCTHMGCPVAYDGDSKGLQVRLPLLHVRSDGGQMVCGQSDGEPAQDRLEYDAKTDSIQAVGVGGLIYGNASPTFFEERFMSTNINDRIALPTKMRKSNMTCHFCIVGCGYNVYKWDASRRGGRSGNQNALGVDFTRQVPPLAIRHDQGDDQHHHRQVGQALERHDRAGQGVRGKQRPVIHPGGKMASYMYAHDGIGRAAQESANFQGDQWLDTGWDNMLALYAGLTKKIWTTTDPEWPLLRLL